MAVTYYEIPLAPSQPVDFSITLGTTIYAMSLRWRDADQGGWVLDIYDVNNNPLVCGIPLVTGLDLLMQYKHLGFIGSLVVLTDGDAYAVPTFDSLGASTRLYFVASA